MDGVGNDRRDLVRAVYEQHCSHARQAENQCLWLTSIFALLCAGSLAVMRGGLFNPANWPLVGFLTVLSLFGLFFCLGIGNVVRAHTDAAELILSRYDLRHYLSKRKPGISGRAFRASRLFPHLFLLGFSFFLFVLLQIGFQTAWTSAPVPLLVFIAGTVAVFRSTHDQSVRPDED